MRCRPGPPRRRGRIALFTSQRQPTAILVVHLVSFSSHSEWPAGHNRPKTRPICIPQPQIGNCAGKSQRCIGHSALTARPMYWPHHTTHPQRPPLICRHSGPSQSRGPTPAAIPAFRGTAHTRQRRLPANLVATRPAVRLIIRLLRPREAALPAPILVRLLVLPAPTCRATAPRRFRSFVFPPAQRSSSACFIRRPGAGAPTADRL